MHFKSFEDFINEEFNLRKDDVKNVEQLHKGKTDNKNVTKEDLDSCDEFLENLFSYAAFLEGMNKVMKRFPETEKECDGNCNECTGFGDVDELVRHYFQVSPDDECTDCDDCKKCTCNEKSACNPTCSHDNDKMSSEEFTKDMIKHHEERKNKYDCENCDDKCPYDCEKCTSCFYGYHDNDKPNNVIGQTLPTIIKDALLEYKKTFEKECEEEIKKTTDEMDNFTKWLDKLSIEDGKYNPTPVLEESLNYFKSKRTSVGKYFTEKIREIDSILNKYNFSDDSDN